jgi:3-oxosteroid 1-dehydrogenase
MTLPLSGCTFGWLHLAALPDALRALSQDGAPIDGLYAVGNAAAFWTAGGYPGPGATLAVGMTMEYRAGQHAAAIRSVRPAGASG